MSIILALAVALVGPLFVDWTAYRAAFEARAGEIVGHPVRVTGDADATLLPYPQLVFTGVAIGADPQAPLMTVGRFEVEVELFPLLSGEVRVTRMELEQPELTLRVGSDGTVDWIDGGAPAAIDPGKVVFDRVDVTDGRVHVLDARRPVPLEVTQVNATLEARSLLGPFKFDGGMVVEGEPVMLRLATGERNAEGGMVVKATLTPASAPVVVSLDGTLAVSEGLPEWTGAGRLERVVAEGEGALPWSVEAEIDADPRRVRARQLEFHYGPEDRPFTISGAANVDLAGDPVFDAVLSARQIDLDRTLGAGPDQPVSLEGALAAVSATVAALPRPPVDGRIGFDIPGVVVGGSLIQSVRLDVSTAPDGWSVETFEAVLPGRSLLTASGRLDARPALRFDGTASLASEQPPTLVAWWYPERPRTDLAAFEASGRVQASAAGLTVSGLEGDLGGARLSGEVSYTPERSGRNAALDLSLSVGEIAAEQVAAVSRLAVGRDEAEAEQATDVVLRVSAERVTGGDTAADGVEVTASLVGGTLDVERFYVRDLAGARISAAGSVRDVGTAPDGSLQARVAAERLDGVADLVRALAPGSALADMLDNAAPVLVPASIEANVTAARVGEGTNAAIDLAGVAGGSEVGARLAFGGRVDRWRDASVDLSLDLAGPNGVRLMRQLGFDVETVDDAGVGRLQASVRGVPAERLDLSVDAALGGTSLDVAGNARVPADAPPTAALDVRLVSDDAGPILALGGSLMADVLASTPVDLRAAADLAGSRLSLAGLRGTVDGEPVSGDLAVDFAAATPAVRGDLALRSARLEGLMELALGPGTFDFPIVQSRSPWPEAPFGPTALDGIDADVRLTVERVPFGDGTLTFDGLATAVRSSAAGIAFDDVEAGFAGGRVSGSLVVKRDLEGQAAVSGTVTAKGVAAEALAWRRDDRPVLSGRLGADLEFDATGRTVAGLVATLAGGGAVRVEEGVIRSFNPRAFGAVIRAADAGQDLPDERIRAVFEDNVDAADLPFDAIEGTFTMAAGVIRAPSLVVDVTGAEADVVGSAMVDLPKTSLESDWTLALAGADGGAAGAPPQVDILFRGRIGDPERRIDVTALSSWLGIRAFERETERVLVMQADILERELLSRAVLRAREDVARRVRAEEEERRRAEEEEALRRAEAERLAAEEAARDAAPQEEFSDAIERRLRELMPGEAPPAEAPPPPTVERPDGSSTVERSVLPPLELAPPPAAGGDPTLPGVSIPPPPAPL